MDPTKKNVLVVAGVFYPEPVTSACMNFDLATSLAEHYNVTVLRPKPTRPVGKVYEEAEYYVNYPFKHVILPSYTFPESKLLGRFRESMSFGKHVAEYIKKHHKEIDFIYNDGWQLFSMYLIAKVATKYHIDYMIPVQDIYPESLLTGHHYPSLMKKIIYNVLFPLDRYYLNHAACIRTISNEMRDYLASTRRLPDCKFLVVNNWQEDEAFQTVGPVEKSSDKFVFSYVGSINMHSNVELMIHAFHKANIPNAEFKIIGGGNRKEACQTLVKQLGITNISFDFVPKQEIPALQSRSDVLVLALPTGNGRLCLPSKLTAYMLSDKPILASVDLDSTTARLIHDSSSGIVVESDNLDQLVQGFCKMYTLERDKLMEMGRNSGDYAREFLTKKVNLKSVTDEIDKLISTK